MTSKSIDNGALPWRIARQQRARRSECWADSTISDALRAVALANPKKLAVVAKDRSITYCELDRDSDRFAFRLIERGFSEGERVLLQLPNSVEFVIAWFAFLKAGLVPVHAMAAHRRSELVHLARESGATAHIVDTREKFDYLGLSAQIREEQPSIRATIDVGQASSEPGDDGILTMRDATTSPVPAHFREWPSPNADDTALLLLSGGTTGLPKLIPRTHNDYVYNALQAAKVAEVGADSVYLAVLPMAFNYTMACPGILGTILRGGTVAVSTNSSPDAALMDISEFGVTITSINPQLVPYWLPMLQSAGSRIDSLRTLQVGSSHLSADLALQLFRLGKPLLQQVYGMAEGLICLTDLSGDETEVCTTQGRPISPVDEVLIVDSQGSELPEDHPGEVWTRGPYTLCGYLNGDAHDANSFSSDGFYRTGDVGIRDRFGRLKIVGRIKDQVNRAGVMIDATAVEDVLYGYPGIRGVGVIGAPDPELGERTVAFIQIDGPSPSVRGLRGWFQSQGVAMFKAPDTVITLDRLPLTAVGKIDKKALRTMYVAGGDRIS